MNDSKKKNQETDIFSLDDDQGHGRKRNSEIDMMEGITDVNMNMSKEKSDSFDSIFNKELDLDIGKDSLNLNLFL